MEDEAEIRGKKTEVVEGGYEGERRTARAERKGGCLEEGFAKISRPPAAAAFRNEERREREVVANDDGVGGRERTTERERERERARRTEGVIGARGTREGAKRERSQKWRKKRNGECTQHRRVRKRAFREYRSSPLDGLSERRRRGSRGGKRLVGGTARAAEGGGVEKGADGKGGRMVVRRRKEGFGRRPGSLGCLWSRHAACAVFSARLTMPACYPSATPNEG